MGWHSSTEPRVDVGFVAENGTPRRIVSYAPASGEVLGEVPVFSTERVREVMNRARVAQAVWADVALEERCERVLALRDVIVDRADELVDLLSAECGKPRLEALVHEVMVIADLATYYAKRATKILAPREIDLHL